jgi:isopenicillin N synthase-like dioxygenase
MNTIPVVSLRDPNALDTLRGACETAGFFYVVDHGVPAAQVAGLFAQARALFDLPAADKAAISIAKSPAMRGHEAIGTQTLDAESLPDLKESFYCGIEHPPTHPYVQRGLQGYGANQWPQGVPSLAADATAYIETLCALAQRLMALLAQSLGEPPGVFGAAQGDPMVTLRLLRYPPHPEGAEEALVGAGAHTDWGAVTILAQDRHGGLEVQLPDGRWVGAPPLEGSFVVNLGDMMPRWTNDRFRSNPHRVRNRASGGEPRYSIPFFFSPDYMTRVVPLPSCVSAARPARYAACTVGEHLREMYEKTYGLQSA